MKKNKHKFGSITTIVLVMLVVMVITSILSLLGFDGKQAIISNGKLETQLVTINNIFSYDGIRYIFKNALTNFQIYMPFVQLILALLTISLIEYSGLLKSFAQRIKKLKFKYLTALVLLISVLSIYFGEYSYAFLLPFIGLLYKKIGKNPILGIITVFCGLTFGYGLGYLYNNYTLGILTQASARVDVDAEYNFSMVSTIYIAIFTLIAFIIACTNIIESKIALKFNNPQIEEDDRVTDKKASKYATIALLVSILVVVYLIIPTKYSGFLLNNDETTYIAKVFNNSPFSQGLPYIALIITMLCSYIYGKVSNNIKSAIEYSEAVTHSFDKMGYTFILMFFISQLIGLINWTNVGNVFAARLVDFMSGLEFSGIPLFIISFLIIIFISIMIPSSMEKWVLLSPIIVPLFMKSNITPDFTQFMFGISDSIGKMLSPIFPYYIIMLGIIYKYKEKSDVSLFSYIKMLMPITLITAGIFILIITSWFLIGLPLGVNILPSL